MSDLPAPPVWLRRVVFVCRQIPEGGGGGTAVEVLSHGLEAAGIAVEHVSVIPGIRAAQFPTQNVFRLGDAHRSPSFRTAAGSSAKVRGAALFLAKRVDLVFGRLRLSRLVKAAGSDTVIIFTNVYGKKILDETGFMRNINGPLMLGQHHSSFEGAARSWELAACGVHFSDVDGFVALTRDDATSFQRHLTVPCVSIPNIAPPVQHASAAPGPVAVALARYSAEKQLDVMIKAFAAATSAPPLNRWQLRLYGEGECHRDLELLIHRLGLTDRVRLMGHTAEVTAALRPASVHLLTSAWEGLPMAILEASAMSVPTIAFDCSAGVRDLVTPTTGVLVPAGDAVGFADALTVLLTNDAIRLRMGDAARHLAAEYQAGPVLARWFSLFDTYSPETRGSRAR